ncbi:putative valacyclovir hydrolase [Myriangium duriaei CBS 260.36]|uniref:Valacyclovir hydrolase n=1 Tax=Myriangium duriaei CBS 260.36 TaxID=1168546 RepID=A0A9P4JAA8_9PEZI|nr:putative valacyclovir hydrolase [Myriangium duriaei CBS 260.36]
MAQTFRLASGRTLSYQVRGSQSSDAVPFVYLHGTPSAYPVMNTLSSGCEKRNFKLISYSRSGYGDSTRNKGRSIIDVVDDVRALLEHLGLKGRPCVVGGWSGGGPHVLACAARLEGCVGALCVAGVAPYDAEGLDWLEGQGDDNIQETKAALEGEEALQKFVGEQRIGLLGADAAGIIQEMSSILPDADKKALSENKEMGDYCAESFQVALQHSGDGWVDDGLAFVKPWGFELSEIKAKVFLYQGSVDLMVPYGHGQWLAKNIPQKYLVSHLIEGEGHISIWLDYMQSMLDELSSVSS